MTEEVNRSRVFGERSEAVERIAPGFFWPEIEQEHLARYRWAAGWVLGRRVLDVACGTGYGAQVLRAAGARSVASIDLSREALKFGSQRYGLGAACADAHQLPIASASFDVVVSLETIEHLQAPHEFVREVRRVLSRGGDLLISTPNKTRSTGRNPYHLREMSQGDLLDLLEGADLQIRGVWGQHWGLSQGVWHKMRGVRRILYELGRRVTVTRWALPGFSPLYWCVRGNAS